MISWAFYWGWFHSNTVSQRWINEREYENLATMAEKLNFGHLGWITFAHYSVFFAVKWGQ